MRVGMFVLAVAAACAPGYAEDDSMKTLRQRASFDLECPEGSIKTVTIDEQTKGVTGCGKRATYVEHCERPHGAYDDECTWILNTDATRRKKNADDE
jgi:hypothetical protein